MASDQLLPEFLDHCRVRGLRVTRERRLVFLALGEAGGPVTRPALLRRLLAEGMHAPTLYRTIDVFVANQIVQPVSRNGESAYELLPPFARHHHHFHCLSCGAVSALQAADEHIDLQVPGKALYHQIDVYGICGGCL